MKTQRHIVVGLLLGIVLFAGTQTAGAQVRDLFNNTNTAAVRNGGAIAPRFLLNVPTNITQVVTYHWNMGQGSRPGTISLRGVNSNGSPNGQVFGPFAAIGTAGFGGALNVNWVANVNVNVPAGFYEVVDTDRNTWSNNFQSASQGFAIVRGSAIPIPPGPGRPRSGGTIISPPPVPACTPVSPVYIRNLRYDDYSSYASLSTTSVAPGGSFSIAIQSNCQAFFTGQVVVTLQDVNSRGGFGYTGVFQLTNVRVNGNVLTAQVPFLAVLQNRTYHVAVFVYGQQPWKTASPGQITIQ